MPPASEPRIASVQPRESLPPRAQIRALFRHDVAVAAGRVQLTSKPFNGDHGPALVERLKHGKSRAALFRAAKKVRILIGADNRALGSGARA